ncbi:MAG: hypothetical protein J7647_13090 [Cyanobacteria bacterium SBLK]|nr:hypothetical protein [Cyanobacteria bacterium SBLK]
MLFLLTVGSGQAFAKECDRDNYNAIDPSELLDDLNLPENAPPQTVAIALFEDNTQESEGRQYDVLTIEYTNPDIVREMFVGLPDDSIQGIRYCLEFKEKLDWAGSQVKCKPGRGHENWGPEPCL